MVRKEDKASSSDANKMKKNKRTSVAVMVLTPLLVLALCLSIMTLVSYKKFIELQGYAAIAFNENAHLKNPSEDNKYRNADALPMKGLTKVTVPDSDKKTEQHEIIYPYYGDKYAELSCRTEEQTLGICDQRTEICHCTDAEEDERRVNAELDSEIEVVD